MKDINMKPGFTVETKKFTSEEQTCVLTFNMSEKNKVYQFPTFRYFATLFKKNKDAIGYWRPKTLNQ